MANVTLLRKRAGAEPRCQAYFPMHAGKRLTKRRRSAYA
ncbi:hypothetical protein ETAE_1675 [Edwardsiella piscicida]|uniref:Uncharacterized protein n=1 Tax=Edwardsiella piscicida TaxID=1263550 RepID=A0AAU8P3E1_EDWPI|nr:hypothetical protein ETAE_1675 [Edwardsiella tarda EIB202]